MVADIFTPIGPAVPVFQLENPLYGEFFSILGIGKVHHPKTAAAYVSYGIAGFQVFPLHYAGNGAVKMNGQPGDPVGNRGGYVLDRLAAEGAIRNRYRIGRYRGRSPAETFKKRPGFPGGGTPRVYAALLV
jgi:hypothetical protein